MSKLPMMLLLVVVVTLLAAVTLEGPLTESAVEPTTQEVTITASDTSANITLNSPHWYGPPDTGNPKAFSVVGGTNAGNITSNCTLSAGRTSVTCSDFTAGDTKLTVSYLKENDDATLGLMLKVFPFLILLAGIAAAMGSVASGGMALAGNTQFSGNMITNVITIFVGVILLPVVLAFVTICKDAYAVAPEYIGVGSILTLMTLVYVLALLSSGFGAVAPHARTIMGRT